MAGRSQNTTGFGTAIESHVAGIPCLIEITDFHETPPWPGNIETCPSSDDYYGYTEITFIVRDRKGYQAPWLERKLTDDDTERIEREIVEYMRS